MASLTSRARHSADFESKRSKVEPNSSVNELMV